VTTFSPTGGNGTQISLKPVQFMSWIRGSSSSISIVFLAELHYIVCLLDEFAKLTTRQICWWRSLCCESS
jgi:hypothetical protein